MKSSRKLDLGKGGSPYSGMTHYSDWAAYIVQRSLKFSVHEFEAVQFSDTSWLRIYSISAQF